MARSPAVASPASAGQRMVWALSRYRAGTGDFNVPVILRIRERPDLPALRRCVDALVARHEALRTSFRRQAGRLEQVVHPAGRVPVKVVDLSAAAEPEAEAIRAVHVEIRTPLDPAAAALRVAVLIIGGSDFVLCFTIHHLVTDASSSALVVRDFTGLYRGAPALPPVTWQYSRFASWQAGSLGQDQKNRHLEYWRTRLAGAAARTCQCCRRVIRPRLCRPERRGRR